jgi:hypothetical protein
MERSKIFLNQEEKYEKIEKLEKEIKTMEYSIQTGNCPEYQNIFRLDEDDYKALIEVRRKKIKELVKDL